MGLVVNVFRSARGDASNGGISSKFDRLTLINVPGPHTPTEDAPAAILRQGNVKGTAVVVPERSAAISMMGGNFAYSSDGRFDEAVKDITGMPFYGAVAIHDRVEG